MRRAGVVLAMLCALALVVSLCGCGSSGVPGPTDSTAKKPPEPPPLPEVGPASGVIIYGSLGTAQTVCQDVATGTETVLPVEAHGTFDVSHAGPPRFLVYHKQVAMHDGQPISNLFAQSEAGGPPVNLVNDELFSTDSPRISHDGAQIAFSGGRWDPDVGDFTEWGRYIGQLEYAGGDLPVGIVGVETLTPDLSIWVQTFAPDVPKGASGGVGDIYVGDTIAPFGSVNITNSSETEYGPDWSPPGDRIAYVHRLQKRQRVIGYDICTMLPDGTGAITAVSKDNSGTAWNGIGANAAAPSWSPDGQQIAFIARESENGSCAIMRSAADGSTLAAQVTDFTLELVWTVKWRE